MSFLPMYDFMLFDPKYRPLHIKSKILFGYLRKKSECSEEDENGEKFCIASDYELSRVINCNPSRVKAYKKQLKKMGMFKEVKIFQQENRLYPIMPDESDLSDEWIEIPETMERLELLD